jgi:hypothetical protein
MIEALSNSSQIDRLKGCYFPVSQVAPGRPDKTARNFLKEHEPLFSPGIAAIDYVKRRIKRVRNLNLVRLWQTYSGIPVFGAEAIVEVDDAGGLTKQASTTPPRPPAFRISEMPWNGRPKFWNGWIHKYGIYTRPWKLWGFGNPEGLQGFEWAL